jgi:hypothetical protein
VLETHAPVDRREERVVPAEVGPVAGEERHAALADDDRAGSNQLAVAGLHAQTLANAVATVLGAGASLLVCHLGYSSFLVLLRRGVAFLVGAAALLVLAAVFVVGAALAAVFVAAGFAFAFASG